MTEMKHNQDRRVIGRPITRVEDLRLVRGRGEYVDDVRHDGMLHALIVRSTRAHGRLISIDVSAARGMPGVHGVFVAQDIMAASGGIVPKIPMRRGKLEGLEPFEQPVIAVEKVRFVGEPLAIIIADTMALAEDAAETVIVDIDPLIAVADCDMAEAGTSLLFEEHGKNLAVTYVAQKGDVAAVNAPYRRRERLSVHRHTAVSIEPRGLVANWSLGGGNKLTVIGAANPDISH
jgi:carbon-monoxide dehydrogenase large subunit